VCSRPSGGVGAILRVDLLYASPSGSGACVTGQPALRLSLPPVLDEPVRDHPATAAGFIFFDGVQKVPVGRLPDCTVEGSGEEMLSVAVEYIYESEGQRRVTFVPVDGRPSVPVRPSPRRRQPGTSKGLH